MGSLPTAFIQAQNSLAPYIKSRQEVCHIRQVLTAHLDSQLNHGSGHSPPPALSLLRDSTTVKASAGNISGLRKEYLKSLRANIKARREYDRVSNINILGNGNDSAYARDVSNSTYSATNASGKCDHLDSYLALIRQRQRCERLHILQDYVDKIEKKWAAATSYIDHKGPQMSRLPQIPIGPAASSASSDQETNRKALKDLIKGLEQAVLRTKVQMKSEKRLLENFKTGISKEHQIDLDSTSRDALTLRGLGQARNELIAWVEEELGKAGDPSPEEDHETHLQSSPQTKESVEDRLVVIRAQYGRYVQARKAFIDAVADVAEPDIAIKLTDGKETNLEDQEVENTPSTTWVLSPYIRDLQLVSNEQKASIQQKSHLTVSLAKQHKETMQLFDRLAHESHLLPTYPQSAVKPSRRDNGQFDIDEMVGKEMPNASHRARTWTFAAESANVATREAVLASTEDGKAVIEDAHVMLISLEQLLGRKHGHAEPPLDDDIWTSGATSGRARAKKSAQQTKSTLAHGDVWATLDGHLGVLQRGKGAAS